MAQFVWCSKNTMESAEALAEKIGCEFGTVPPPNFDGDIICLGAAPAANFNWKSRKGTFVNDPRKTRKYIENDGVEMKKKVPVGTSGRAFFVGGKFIKAVNADKNPIAVSKQVQTMMLAEVAKLDSPDIVALDFALSGNGASYVITKVVFGPALTDHPDVVDKIAEEYSEGGGVDDATFVKNLLTKASPDELKALRSVMRNLKKELEQGG